MVWISVVLVIAVGLFFLRDNIAKFINNAATQIAGEESDDELSNGGVNEYGFYYGKEYVCNELGYSMIFTENGYMELRDSASGGLMAKAPCTYSNGVANLSGSQYTFSPDGKTVSVGTMSYILKE